MISISFHPNYPLLNSDQNAQECDATQAQSGLRSPAHHIKNFYEKMC